MRSTMMMRSRSIRMIRTLRSAGRAEDVALKLAGGQSQAVASGSAYRQDNALFYIVRLVPLTVGGSGRDIFENAVCRIETDRIHARRICHHG